MWLQTQEGKVKKDPLACVKVKRVGVKGGKKENDRFGIKKRLNDSYSRTALKQSLVATYVDSKQEENVIKMSGGK